MLLLVPAKGGPEGQPGALWAHAHLGGKGNPASVFGKGPLGKGSVDEPLGWHQ